MWNNNAEKPWDRGSGRAVKTAASVAGLIVIILAFYLFLREQPWGGHEEPGAGDILETREAREWIAGCEQRNPYIKEKCPDLFYYDYALDNNKKDVCEFISDEDIRRSCRVYFKIA